MPIAATVNGKPISAARLDEYVKQVLAQGKQTDTPQLRASVKNDLIGREVLVQEADKQGYAARAEIKAQIDTVRQSIIINALLGAYLKKNPVQDADIKAEYDKYKAQAMAAGDKEYHARHILVTTEDEAKAIIVKLKDGAKFDELAKVSKDGSAANGGLLGWSRPGNFVKPFGDALSALKKDQITDTPVKTQFGYHVIKLEDTREAKIPEFDQVKAKVAESLQQGKLQAYRTELMNKAKIQ